MSEENLQKTDEEQKVMSPEDAKKLTYLCSQQADQFLQHIRPYFANREEEYGTQWALENYMRMALLPGIYVVRQSLSNEAIKEMMPSLEKMILEYKILEEEVKENEI